MSTVILPAMRLVFEALVPIKVPPYLHGTSIASASVVGLRATLDAFFPAMGGNGSRQIVDYAHTYEFPTVNGDQQRSDLKTLCVYPRKANHCKVDKNVRP